MVHGFVIKPRLIVFYLFFQRKKAQEDSVGEFPEEPSAQPSQQRAADRGAVRVPVTSLAAALLAQTDLHHGEVLAHQPLAVVVERTTFHEAEQGAAVQRQERVRSAIHCDDAAHGAASPAVRVVRHALPPQNFP